MSLVELRIRNLAVFREAVVPVPGGFVALTGETGAGKSVVVAALRLALGGRVDWDPIAPGASGASVSAVFDEVPATVADRLASLGIPADDLTTLSRELSRTGRGSCRVNGALVSLAVLRDVGDALAEITEQGSSQRLLQGGRQRDLLDLAADAGDLRDATRTAVTRWREGAARLIELRRLRTAGAAEIDAARRLVAEIASLRLTPGEDAALAAERLRLRHAATLTAAAAGLHRAVLGTEDSGGAADMLAAAAEAAASMPGVDATLDDLVNRAAQLVDELRELGSTARHLADSIAVDEARLGAVEERLDVVARVRRRHGSIEDALAAVQVAEEMLAASDGGDGELESAAGAVASARAEAAAAALALSRARHAAAQRLESEVATALHLLELPHARFRVLLSRHADPDGVEVDGTTVACGIHGIDEVAFQLATNRGTPPRPLDAGPSGGELSRLVLALSACVSERGSPLLVLDEVDTGIGGETAARVGDLLATAGRARQVVAVTHRAEIASRADQHIVVSKDDGPEGVAATAVLIDGDQRLAEIARLMSGRVTDAALARAVELRGEAMGVTVPAGRRR